MHNEHIHESPVCSNTSGEWRSEVPVPIVSSKKRNIFLFLPPPQEGKLTATTWEKQVRRHLTRCSATMCCFVSKHAKVIWRSVFFSWANSLFFFFFLVLNQTNATIQNFWKLLFLTDHDHIRHLVYCPSLSKCSRSQFLSLVFHHGSGSSLHFKKGSEVVRILRNALGRVGHACVTLAHMYGKQRYVEGEVKKWLI